MDRSAPSQPLPAVSLSRKLAAILSADVQGYSRLMGDNEVATITTLTAYRTVMTTLIQQHHGRVVDSPGDNLLAEFVSAVEAVQAAVAIQHALRTRNTELPEHRQMRYRIGLNVGDVMEDGQRLYGDGVNIAARIESLAEGGGVSISGTVYDQVRNKLALTYADQGTHQVKNIAEPVRVYRVVMDEAAATLAEQAGPQPLLTETPLSERIPRVAERPRSRVHPVVFVLASVLLVAGLLTVRYFPSSSSNTQPPTPDTQALPLPDKPSIVVLPFVNMSNDPAQEYFSDGIVEDITTGLARISSLFVIARNSAFTYKGKAVKVQDVSKEIGVQYVLEGSVRKSDNQVRVTAQLIDATTGAHLWAERFDRPLKDIFAVQDEIVQKIVTTLKLQLPLMEQGYLVRKRTENLEAYDFYLRGVESLFHGWSETKKEASMQARQLFERATELDPTYAEAYAYLGVTYWHEWFFRWNPAPQVLGRAFELEQKALTLDEFSSLPHVVLGFIALWKKQHEQALVEARRALALDPNNAENLTQIGQILAFSGQPQEGIELVEKAMRLNPRYPPIYVLELSLVYRMAGRYEKALAPGEKFLALAPNSLPAHFNLAVIYSELGREEEARTVVAGMLRLVPNVSVEVFRQFLPFKDPADLERHLNALRKAGLK